MSINPFIDDIDQTPFDPFEVVDNDFKQQNLIDDGLRFLASITEYYSPEKGLELWNLMGQAFGDEIKGKVFFKMITGEAVSGRVVFTTPQNTNQAVPIIKCIRTYTGYGLKEAKDAMDRSKTKPEQLDNIKTDARKDFVRELRVLGCRVQ